MKARHRKLDGYRAALPAMRPSPRLPTLAAPLHCRLLRFYALIPSPFYPPPNLRKYLLCRIQERRAAPPLPPPSPWEKPHGPIPRPEHLSYFHPPHSLHPVPPQPPPHRNEPRCARYPGQTYGLNGQAYLRKSSFQPRGWAAAPSIAIPRLFWCW